MDLKSMAVAWHWNEEPAAFSQALLIKGQFLCDVTENNILGTLFLSFSPQIMETPSGAREN